MTKISQGEKNIKLSQNLASFILNHPEKEAGFPSKVSYVVFSRGESNLNKINEELLESLLKGGQKVVKAEKTGKSKNSWTLTPCFG